MEGTAQEYAWFPPAGGHRAVALGCRQSRRHTSWCDMGELQLRCPTKGRARYVDSLDVTLVWIQAGKVLARWGSRAGSRVPCSFRARPPLAAIPLPSLLPAGAAFNWGREQREGLDVREGAHFVLLLISQNGQLTSRTLKNGACLRQPTIHLRKGQKKGNWLEKAAKSE